MRSINTLEWHAGQATLPLKTVSLSNTMLVKLAKYTLQVLFYVPYQFNKYLDSLDAAPNNYRKQIMHENHESLQSAKHQHIPTRVWKRRSALLTILEEQQLAKVSTVEKTDVAPVCQVQSAPSEDRYSSCSFNVLQVKSLPVWASNFSELGMIEQELDFYSQPKLLNKVV